MKKSYGASDQNLRLWIEFSRLNLVITREVFRDFSEFDLSPSQFAVIEALYHKGELSIGEVRRVILMTSGNLTVVTKNLEKRGLIQIRPGQDRRQKLLSITDTGKAVLEQVFPRHVARLDGLLDSYTETEKTQLIQLLHQGRKQMQALLKEND